MTQLDGSAERLTAALERVRKRGGVFDDLPEEEKRRLEHEYDRALEADRLRVQRARIQRRIEALIPTRFRGFGIELPAVRAWVERFLANPLDPEQRGLLLVGPTGVGKTGNAWAAVRTLLEHDYRGGAAYRSVPLMLAELRPRDDATPWETIRELQSVGVLFLDDLGAHKPSEWVAETLFNILDYRSQWCRKTIVTSNLEPSAFASTVGDRLASRLAEMCELIRMTGPDRRRVRPVELADERAERRRVDPFYVGSRG